LEKEHLLSVLEQVLMEKLSEIAPRHEKGELEEED
jgi:hypothetical protein